MLEKIISLFHDRRKRDAIACGDRRKMSRAEANCKLAEAVTKFGETISMKPETVKKLLVKVK